MSLQLRSCFNFSMNIWIPAYAILSQSFWVLMNFVGQRKKRVLSTAVVDPSHMTSINAFQLQLDVGHYFCLCYGTFAF
ncbi:hypothetical protein HanRHA438_Chr09g0373781 [Helianthus annuus]|nr:hypothetical protein HanRHA438_Chr09g0373781 [Helianthus annuus]